MLIVFILVSLPCHCSFLGSGLDHNLLQSIVGGVEMSSLFLGRQARVLLVHRQDLGPPPNGQT
eukprot:6431828-Amphidinium_carterae.1